MTQQTHKWLKASRRLLVVFAFLGVSILSWFLMRRPLESRSVVVDGVERSGAERVALAATETYTHCRFGFGATGTGGPPSQYDVASLNAGWYWDWGARATPSLSSVEHVQTIRLSPTPTGYSASPTGTKLLSIASARPGARWFIGNEPDCIWQDNMRSDLYAQAYHDLYYLIKGADPTAQIGVGSIVQPTPQRMRYLDRILAAYVERYGEPLPTDFWVTHSYILCETCFVKGYEPWGWGACPVPDWPDPNDPPDEAVHYSLEDHWRLDIFQQRLIDFRRWMRDRGYRDVPLLVSEYGILFYYPFEQGDLYKTEDDAIAFMQGTFDWMREARDSELGYPADDNRLVQRWAWFSLDHIDWEMGGALFDNETYQPFKIGLAYAEYTADLSPVVDLVAVDVRQTAPTPYSPTQPVSVTLDVQVSNAGNVPLTAPFTVRFLDAAGSPIAEDQVVASTLSGCGATVSLHVVYPNLEPGAYPVRVVVDPEGEIAEADEQNNETTGTVLVATNRLFLPLVRQEIW